MVKEIRADVFKPLSIGEIVEGKVVGKEKSTVFLELENFGIGIITGKELAGAKEVLKDVKTGDKISAKILEIDNEEGYVELSLLQASEEINWQEMKKMKEKGQILEVAILKANKGGLMTEIEGVSGFLPVSQLSPEHYPKVENGDQTKILRELQKFTGKKMKVKILSLDQKQKSLILSEREAALEEKRGALADYKVGDVVEGEVTGIFDFGVFIKFLSLKNKSFIEGLIHISELDWQLIKHPSEIVKMGEKVKARIIEISNGRVSLSLKALKKDPWLEIDKKYKEGEEIFGKVIKFNPFGAFVEITPKIQGLIHISEFGTEKKMKEILKIGEKYKFQISSIKPKEHRIILKLI